MLNKFIQNKFLPPLSIALAVIAYWHPILFNNAFFYDDWGVIEVFRAGKFSLQYVFLPHSQHLYLIFKPLFFVIYKIFGENIIPCMVLSISMHIANALLFYYLCRLIFAKRKWVPFCATLFFALNSAYYEVLHWFIVFNYALSMFFLLSALILLHKYVLEKKDWMLYASAFFLFLMPLGVMLGVIGIFFILLYARLVLKQLNWKLAIPYLTACAFYTVLFLWFVVFGGHIDGKNFFISIDRILQTVLAGLLGSWFKSMGFSEVANPYSILLSVILTLQSIFIGYFLLLHFILNPRKERIKVFGDRGVMWFCLLGAFLSYMVLGFSRASLNMDSFIFWGRYHYFPIFFFSILAANSAGPLLAVLKKVFKERRAAGFLIFVLVIFLATHFFVIRAKAFSSFRVEGAVPQDGVMVAATSSTDTL